MSTRYENLFSSLHERGEGAFVPFIMLGDPTPEDSLRIVRTVVAAGADALELGVPFSDPVADGPTIQASHLRALDGGATVDSSLELISTIRTEFPELPIGMLIYGNVAFTRGFDRFYAEFAKAGADSILLPDVPVREGAPFIAAAQKADIDPIFIAPARATEETLKGVAKSSQGYIYAISRDGVTGTEKQSETLGLEEVVSNIQRFDGPPVLLGFGISEPTHVQDAIAAGAAGAITGSAITKIIDRRVSRETDTDGIPLEGTPGRIDTETTLHEELTEFVSRMKAATQK
ncbi:tryptophan synthase subunit alpha [Corynebacterium tuberculostearicum]|uniref:tryptophan synthase subunit alpha n=1 Tax=Corynebacterium tuberculostearicum TaxID=38304 RepID=UPI00265C9397|nr:tryptophan synthase subunit alpha [Corynebacterium tuberculostearicum]WKE56990.1 tryptophan synthase subunit alpha [Corynebacterium tuberculostearicum]